MPPVAIDLAQVRRERAARDSAAVVDVWRDESPDNLNVNYYRIRGTSFAAVQMQINGLTAEVESFGNGGNARSIGPRDGRDGYFYAVCRVEMYPDA